MSAAHPCNTTRRNDPCDWELLHDKVSKRATRLAAVLDAIDYALTDEGLNDAGKLKVIARRVREGRAP